MITTEPLSALEAYRSGETVVIYNGDCRKLIEAIPENFVDLVLTSPPYFVGKKYDTSRDIYDFEELHRNLAPLLTSSLKGSGNACWQVGNYVNNGRLIPLEYVIYPLFSNELGLTIRNRIVWTFGHGTHATKRLSGRHESLLWFGKTPESYFDLDPIRVKQKYRGKKSYKGPNKGSPSANPRGKNPGDVWDIPNVKANHVEKTAHPCQFPIALAQRCVRAFCPPGGLVIDPFLGAGTTAIASLLEGRSFIGAEINPTYCEIAQDRICAHYNGKLKLRPLDKPIYTPSPGLGVAKDPFTHLETLLEYD
ncbi:site-specific DNA-methyltransferase [Algiphilus sp. NNCM1]|nr:site-specific DNA-methyltransferase [Algiphilus acroporae]